jgi:hypothetical protein
MSSIDAGSQIHVLLTSLTSGIISSTTYLTSLSECQTHYVSDQSTALFYCFNPFLCCSAYSMKIIISHLEHRCSFLHSGPPLSHSPMANKVIFQNHRLKHLIPLLLGLITIQMTNSYGIKEPQIS